MHNENTESPLPCHNLLEEIQLALLPIVHQLPIVQSMLKWAHSALERKKENASLGWMLLMDGKWTVEHRHDHLFSLKKAVSELNHPLKEIMPRIHEFRLHRPIQTALVALHDCYQKLPPVDRELHRLTLGESLLDSKDLIPLFLSYTEKVSDLQEKTLFLKQLVIQEMVQHISKIYPKDRMQ